MVSGRESSDKSANYSRYPAWTPRFWHGMPSHVWWSLLARNRFRIRWTRAHIAAAISFFTPFNDVLALSQHLLFGRQIQNTQLHGPPIFILGHWRSGTTLLHEFLELDQRFASPTTYSCFAPWHFLLTEGMMQRFGNFLLPEHRPMDNMRAGWSLPQEDEFALMNLGAPTPYLRIAFPQHEPPYLAAIDMKDLTPSERHRWKQKMDWFMRALSYKLQKPLIIKSPPHTGRIGMLYDMYPDAKFVHIVRDPRKLYPSTMRLWRALDFVQGLQAEADEQKLQAYVLESLTRMYDAFESQRHAVPAKQLVHIKYEDLIANPITVLESTYDQLQLGEFDAVRPLVMQRLEQDREYQTNQHQLDPATEARVLQAWQSYAQRYGYITGRST